MSIYPENSALWEDGARIELYVGYPRAVDAVPDQVVVLNASAPALLFAINSALDYTIRVRPARALEIVFTPNVISSPPALPSGFSSGFSNGFG